MPMRPLHERFLETITEERERLASRRGFLAGTAGVAGGALALGLVGAPRLAAAQDATPEAGGEFEDDIDVLNYALTLEHLEYAFYRDGLETLDFEGLEDPFGELIADRLAEIRDHEQAHVETLTSVIEELGGEPVPEAEYDFGEAFTDTGTFLATAQALENTGVSAYDGAGAALSDPDLLTAAGTIVAVEARHASYLNLVNGVLPFPEPFETPLTRDEVLAIAGPFIVADEAVEDEATPGAEDEATPDA
jgi:rubrerythrin